MWDFNVLHEELCSEISEMKSITVVAKKSCLSEVLKNVCINFTQVFLDK